MSTVRSKTTVGDDLSRVGTSLVQHLEVASKIVDDDAGSVAVDESARMQALELAKKLVARLEKPEEVILRYAWEVRVPHCYPPSLAVQDLTIGLMPFRVHRIVWLFV